MAQSAKDFAKQSNTLFDEHSMIDFTALETELIRLLRVPVPRVL